MNTAIAETDTNAVTMTECLPSEPEPAATERPSAAEIQAPTPVDSRILRFHFSERMLHWAIAVPFLICAVSGLILLFGYDLRSNGNSRNLFSWLHRIGGLALIFTPGWSVIKNLRNFRIHLKNVRIAAKWTANDLKWVALAGPAALSRKYKLPDQHKFNAAEKINFIVGFITYPLFIATGVLLLLPGTHFLAWILHAGMALLVVPLIIGHIFMAVVNPSTRPGLSGMFSGYVDREWAKHHYRIWYQETYGGEEAPAPDQDCADESGLSVSTGPRAGKLNMH